MERDEERVAHSWAGLGGFCGLPGGAKEDSMVVLSSPPCSRRLPNLCWLSGMTGVLGTKPAGWAGELGRTERVCPGEWGAPCSSLPFS